MLKQDGTLLARLHRLAIERADPDELEDLAAEPRPVIRADCLPGGLNEERPCIFASCRFHTSLEVTAGGTLLVNNDWDDGRDTCALDVADREGGATLEQVGYICGLTRERARQIEEKALRRVRILTRRLR